MRHPFGPAPAVGEVDVEKDERLELMDEHPAFGIEARLAQPGDHLDRRLPGIRHCAAVALPLGRVPGRLVFGRPEQRRGELVGAGLGLLHRHQVGLAAREPVQEALLLRRPDAVHVP